MMAACSQQIMRARVELHAGVCIRGHAGVCMRGFVAGECCGIQSILDQVESILSSCGKKHARVAPLVAWIIISLSAK